MSTAQSSSEKALTSPTEADDCRPYTPRKFNATTKQRFMRDRWRRLVAHVGGAPTEVQKLRIECIIGLEWDIARLRDKMDRGELSEHATRQLLACHNHLRMQLSALGQPVARKAPSLNDYLASKRAASAQPEGAAA